MLSDLKDLEMIQQPGLQNVAIFPQHEKESNSNPSLFPINTMSAHSAQNSPIKKLLSMLCAKDIKN